jgi:hypothetical protein
VAAVGGPSEADLALDVLTGFIDALEDPSGIEAAF